MRIEVETMDAKDFQDMIDKAADEYKATGIPVTVYLPAGNHTLDQPLVIPRNVNIIVVGKPSND
jgi:hypothetical protein